MIKHTRHPRRFLITTLLICLLPISGYSRIPDSISANSLISITVDANAARQDISPYIYGLNFATQSFANEIDLPLRRWGGNSTSRYNWQNGNYNNAADWYFENNTMTNAYNWNNPETHDEWVAQNIATSTDSLITIPMLGYVAKDNSSCGFDRSVHNTLPYTNQNDYDPYKTRCGNGISNGNPIIGNDPLDTSVAVDEAFMQGWVEALVTNYGNASAGGVKFYALDNEPELWSSTHRDVHPAAQTYDELYNKGVLYGEAIKTADPNAQTLGFVAFGWSGYFYSQSDLQAAAANGYSSWPEYESHGNLHQVPWYLSQMKAYEDTNNTRLLDYLDLHYYTESGVALQTAGDAAEQELRLRSTRALWDPTYRDESWIGGDDQSVDMRYVRLIPRMKDWVNTFYPGTKLAITEYNFGGLEHINGALAQAETLGIFGREGLDLAALWNYPYPNDPLGYNHFDTLPGAYAFRMFRNYDSSGSKFGDISISAISNQSAQLSIFGAERSADGALTLMFINKTSGELTSDVSLANFNPAGTAQVYQYSNANLNAILQKPAIGLEPAGFTHTFPANSITLIVIPQSSGAETYTKTLRSHATQDGWVLESGESSGKGGTKNNSASTLNLGDDSANRQYRIILAFDTSSLPDDAVISKVLLKVKRASITGGGNPIKLFKGILVDVKSGSFGTASLSTADFQTKGSQTLGAFLPAVSNNWYSVNLSAAVTKINKAGSTQIRLRFKLDDNNNFSANILKLFSGNASPAQRPLLIITYQ